MISLITTLLACADYKSNLSEDQPLDFPYGDTGSNGSNSNSYEDCPGILENTRLAIGENLCFAFKDIASDVGLTDSGNHVGVYAFDYNSDSLTDLYVTNSSSDSVLYQNNGDSFQNISGAAGLDFSSDTSSSFQINDIAVSASDLVAATSAGCFLMKKSGNTYTTDKTAFDTEGSAHCKSAIWFGSDVILGTDSGVFYFENSDGENFSDVTHDKDIYDYDDIATLESTDIDHNGYNDFVALKEVGPDRVYFSNGNNNDTFSGSDIYSESTANLGPATQADFVQLSPDESLGLSISRSRSDNYLEYTDNTFVDDADDLGLSSPSDTRATAYGDLLGDGNLYAFKANHDQDSEILIRTVDENGNPDYFYNEFPELGFSINEKLTGTATIDFNGDGQDDIATVSEDGKIHLLENDSY